MDFQTSHSERIFSYKITPKEGGGYIAESSAPQQFPTLEGATQDEVREKVQAKLQEVLAAQSPRLAEFVKQFAAKQGVNVNVHESVNIKVTGTHGGKLFEWSSDGASKPKADDLISSSSGPITYSSSSGGSLWRILGAIFIAAIVLYWWLRG